MAKRVDANQAEIVAALRACGCSVQDIHTTGAGCPDLLVGHSGYNFTLEVKSSAGKLNAREAEWHRNWRGQVATVRTIEQSLAAVGLSTTPADWQTCGHPRAAIRYADDLYRPDEPGAICTCYCGMCENDDRP